MTEEKTFVFEQLNPDACKTYLIASRSGEAVLVDPVLGSTPDYLRLLESRGLRLRYVVDTHTHADHLSGARLLVERTGADYAMHHKAGARHASVRLSDGSTLKAAGVLIEAIETPGHTKDSITLKIPGRVLTGDWLFIGGAGRTDLPGGDPGEHWESLNRVIPSLDETTLVCPGHDYNGRRESSLQEEKRANANLAPRDREEYVAWLRAMASETPSWMVETLRVNNEGALDPTLSFMPADAASACMCQPGPSGASSGVPEVSVLEVSKMTSSGPGEKRLLLDVRQPDEYAGSLGHVPGAVLIPLPELSGRLSEIASFREATVITICRSGARSAKAAEILMSAGFRDVWNMTGGTLAWREKGLPVER